MKPILLVARWTLAEATRRKVSLALLAATVLFLGLYLLGVGLLTDELARRSLEGGGDGHPRGQAVPLGFLTLMGMYVVNFLSALSGVVASTGALGSAAEAGALLALLSRPIRRAEFVLGRWLGLAALVVPYALVLSGGVILGTWAVAGYLPPEPLAAALLVALNSLLLLSVGMLASSLLSGLGGGLMALMLFGVAWAGGLVAGVGRALDAPAMARAGELSSGLLPTDALWKAASVHLQPQALLAISRVAGPAGNPFVGTEPAGPALVLGAAAYAAAAVALASWVFSRRDL